MISTLNKQAHPLSEKRRGFLRNYRIISQLLGKHITGRFSCLMYRQGLLKSEQKSYFVLNTQPLVIYLGNVMNNVFDIAELFRNEPVHFIKNFYHSFENKERLASLKGEVEQFWRHYPQHTINFICATETEKQMFEDHGILPCHFINKNAFVDENQYRIFPEINKEFDAIYNGQLAPYKRHELASKIENLALIVYRHGTIGRTEESDRHAKRIRELLKNAAWLNDVDCFIPPSQISSHLNRAKVGLALSKEEGPMAACMEYFLCGLPVVSTPSLGGRDVFFDDEYVMQVQADPESVNKGVTTLIDRNVAPELIRQKTLEKMNEHRGRFVNLVNGLIAETGALPDFESRFQKMFVNKMRTAAPFPGALLTHAAKGMPVELCRSMASHMNA